MELFQGAQKALQAVRQGDGGRGIGQQEGAGNQHQNAARHKDRPLQALCGDGQLPELHQHHAAIGIEQIQHASEHQNDYQRLHARYNGLGRDLRHRDGKNQKAQHHPIGNPALGQKQRHNIENYAQQLRAGIQAVNHRGSGEILPQGNVFQHMPFPSFSRRSSATA